MEKRTLLAMFLILVVFYVSQELLWKKRPAPAPTKPATESVKSTPADNAPASTSPLSLSGAPAIDSTRVSQVFFDAGFIAANNHAVPAGDTVSIEDSRMRIMFTNRGGSIRSVVLKEFTLPDQKTPVDLIPSGHTLFDLTLKLENGQRNLSDLNFEHEVEPGGKAITFFVRRDSLRLLERRYELTGNFNLKYTFRTNTGTLQNGGIEGYRILWDSGIADTEKPVDDRNASYVIKAQIDNKLQDFKFAQLKSPRDAQGNVNWAALRSKYFGLALIPEKRLNVGNLKATRNLTSPVFTLDVANRTAMTSLEDHYDLYFGPCSYLQLHKYQPVLKDVAEMGWKWLFFLSRFFLWLFTYLHMVIPNYGLVILVFSLIIKLLTYPLTKKSLESGQKMQKIQPMIREIQTKYKRDPKQMQVELARVYKENRVSPLGGCLPLLLQMPVFFALYPALRFSLEIRQAGFVSWLKDLSIPDPYYILPILMGVAMFVQSKLMPQPQQNLAEMDDKQRAMMQSTKMMTWIMPIFMFFIFKSLPSGMVLYWMAFNVYSIVQQYLMMRKQHSA